MNIKGFDTTTAAVSNSNTKADNNSVGKSDDLVERVIESMKVLNKKEEEIKQHAKLITDK